MKIGFETHIPLDTETKLFSDEARGQRSPYAAGEPGTRPSLQRKAVKHGIKLALTLDMDIADTLSFDRKQYFYPDLPKGYQITQHRHPLATQGVFSTSHGDALIKELHIEEDPSRTMKSPSKAYIDDSRSGEPLIELVTTPCFHDIDEALAFLDELTTHANYLGIMDAAKGFKTDTNISIEPTQHTRVEIKNITGRDNVKDALQYEAWRQHSAVETGHTIERETRHYDSLKGMTKPSRDKETYTEYAFIPEPDIPSIKTESLVSAVKKDLPRPRQTIINELVDQGISKQEATTIASHPAQRHYYDTIRTRFDAATTQTIVTQHLPHVLDQHSKTWHDIPDDKLQDIVVVADQEDLPENTIKDLLWQTLFNDNQPRQWVEDTVSDDDPQQTMQALLDEHPSRVQAYKDGNKAVINAFMGDLAQAHPEKDKKHLLDIIEHSLEDA